jgi:hypothetical protein
MRTKSQGQHAVFDTGAMREEQFGKPAFDKIPINVLDTLQFIYGGATMVVDSDDPPITGFATENLRSDLIPYIALNRLAALYGRGALKYEDNNWMKGMPLSRIYASLLRHVIAWAAGDTSEDHLAAVMWNAAALMWTETAINDGKLSSNLADKGPMSNENN